MDKRYKWTLPLLALALASTAAGYFYELPLLYAVTTSIFGFLIGFALGVERVYTVTTGRPLDDDGLTNVLERIL